MGTYRISVICLYGYILASVIQAASQDICESCKHIDDCPRYAEMSKEQQLLWIQNFSCNAPHKREGTFTPGFSTVAKGDYVCCPTNPVWGIDENHSEPETMSRDENNINNQNNSNFQLSNYPQYNHNRHNDNRFWSYMDGQAGLIIKPQSAFYNTGNYDSAQCIPQSAPPNPQSGCCGIQKTDSHMITDLQQFLQLKTTSKWGSRQNYYRYRRDSSPKDVTFEDRIAGGHKTNLDQYPWTALLNIVFVDRNVYTYILCGGSLISSRFVLTAAHCMFNENSILNRVDVTLAEYDKRTFPSDCVNVGGRDPICIENLRISADNVIVHRNYYEKFLINDIALIRLQSIVPYARDIRPICLPPINIDSPQFSDLSLATAGWGLNVAMESDVKQFTVIYMVPKRECSVHYPQLTAGHLCASGKMSEDTCKGDSGGPLMMLYEGKYYVVGIVSGKTAAFPCGTPVPSLYTNVYQYLDWIRYHVG